MLFAGAIPKSLGEIADLKILTLRNNKLTFEIPPELGNLSKLEEFYLNDNKLKGELHKDLEKLAKLTLFHVHNNKLEGNVPKKFDNSSTVDFLYGGNEGGLRAPVRESGDFESDMIMVKECWEEVRRWLDRRLV